MSECLYCEGECSVGVGFCHCGCGGVTQNATRTSADRKHVMGQPLYFIRGHKLKRKPGHWRDRLTPEQREIQRRKLRNHNLQKAYGITLDDYERMEGQQGSVCAICRKAERRVHKGVLRRLSVDHCHDTGKVRGLLCGDCNNAVGLIRDCPEAASRLVNYLLKKEDLS